MTPEQSSFIDQHLNQHGYKAIAASRTRWDVQQPTGWRYSFSENDHNEFGYNGLPFGLRDSPNSVFYVSYGKPTEPLAGLASVMDQTLIKIADTFGTFATLYSDTYFSRGLRKTCQRLGLPFVELNVRLEGQPPYKSEIFSQQIHHTVTTAEFLDFSEEFGRKTLCRRPISIFHALLADISTYPVIFPTFPLSLCNQNYDPVAEDVCGPAFWTLSESEDDYSIHRFLYSRGKAGIPNLWRYSPELMAALLDSSILKKFIYKHSQGKSVPDTGSENRLLICQAFRDKNRELRVWREENYKSGFRNELDFEELFAIRENAKYRAYMGALDVTKRNFRSHQHHIPLYRILSHLGVCYDNLDDATPATYGPVV